jgi:hypothetical protein
MSLSWAELDDTDPLPEPDWAQIAERTAEYDALYGRDRKRPRMPDDLVALIRRGQLTVALAAYRQRFPALAKQAAQAIEDGRAYFAPDTAPLG